MQYQNEIYLLDMYSVGEFRSTGLQHCSDWLSQWRWGTRWCLKNITYSISESYLFYKIVFTSNFIAQILSNRLTNNQNLFDQDVTQPTSHLSLYICYGNLLFKPNDNSGILFFLWTLEISNSYNISCYGLQIFKKHWKLWLFRLLPCSWNW